EDLPQQVVFLLPLLEGLDGVKKMSKSFGNFVGITEPASDIFGKLMSISDELMARYYPLLVGRAVPSDTHPMEAKKQLAFEIAQTYHSTGAAKDALEAWNTRFSEKRISDADLPMFLARSSEAVAIVVDAYREAFSIAKSRADASRLIKQGSVQLDGEKLGDPKMTLSLRAGQTLRLDKTRAVRIR